MPCYDDRNSLQYVEDTRVKPLQQKLDERTAQLCKLCRLIEIKGQGDLIRSVGLWKWWQSHKELDRAREVAEEQWRQAKIRNLETELARLKKNK